jgi:CRISPR-associated endonuclease Cas3-HD
MIYDTTASYIDDKVRESIRLAGLLHDIGKGTEFFQARLKKNIPESLIESDLPKKYPFAHNEVGYAFLHNHLVSDHSYDKNLVLYGVYWHHGVNPDNIKKDSLIYKKPFEISNGDTNTMIEFAVDILGNAYFNPNPDFVETSLNMIKHSTNVSDLNDDTNETKLLFISCIITADRLVSSGVLDDLSDDDILSYIKNYNSKVSSVDVETHVYREEDPERFLSQLNIVDKIIEDENNGLRTHIINAPGGFGKTMLLQLLAMKKNKQLIAACPRIDVADSLYNTVIKDLKGFVNGSDVTIELYYNNEVISKNHNNNEGFKSDIVITIIDSFLRPSIDNRFSHRLFTVLESDVVFDEYDELVGDSALFGLFVKMVRTRHNMTNASTVLLSATPMPMEFLWDSTNNKTVFLPEKHKHFKAQHSEGSLLRVIDDFNIQSLGDNKSALVVLNSISNAQKAKASASTEHTYHSRFTKADRKIKQTNLYTHYGLDTPRTLDKPNFVGTPAVQASFNVSFQHVYESVLSPQATLQRFFRCNRTGDCEPGSTLTTFRNILGLDKATMGENAVRDILYTTDLSILWYDELKTYDGKTITPDGLCEMYNDFIRKNEPKIKNYLMSQYKESLNRLSKIYPEKFFFKSKSDVKTAGGNKLRTTNDNKSVFYIAPYYNDPDKYSDAVSEEVYGSFTEHFSEDDNHFMRLVKTFKFLRDQNDERFDFNDILKLFRKGLTLDHVRHHAKRENTPYIRFDKVYHPDYGFVDPRILP